MENIKTYLLATIGVLGATIAELLGGWDWGLQSLIIFITIDFILGFLVAAVWEKSNKTVSGTINSKACWQGLIRKGGMLLIVLIATRLDILLNTNGFVRTAVILYFVGNEGISIVENLGTMGVPLPSWLKKKFENLRNDNDKISK